MKLAQIISFVFLIYIPALSQNLNLVPPVGHTEDITSIQFSPDNNLLVSTDRIGTIKVWDIASGKLLHDLDGHIKGEYSSSANFSPDGKMIASIAEDKAILLWSVSSGSLIHRLTGHTNQVNSAQFSPDGKMLVSAGDKTVKLWDATSGKLIHNMTGHNKEVQSAHFSPEGDLILSAGYGRTVIIWDVTSGNLLHELPASNPDFLNSETLTQFSPDGKMIVTLGRSQRHSVLKIWGVSSGKMIDALNIEDVGPGTLMFVRFSSDSKMIVFASDAQNVKVWDVASGRVLHNLSGAGYVKTTFFRPDGKILIPSVSKQTVKIIDVASGRQIHALSGQSRLYGFPRFSPDGKLIAAADEKGVIKLWSVINGNLLHDLRGRTAIIESAYFSPDGTMIATTGADKTFKFWEIESSKLLLVLNGYSEFSFSPDSKLISAILDETIEIWEVGTGKLLLEFEGHTDVVESALFSPDNKMIVSTSWDQTAKIWDATTGTLIHSLTGHTSWVWSAIFSPDGDKIVTASEDKTAKIWSVKSGELIGNLPDHTLNVRFAQFSPDGKMIVTAGSDQTIKIWEAASGWLLHDLYVKDLESSDIAYAKFSPDSKMIMLSSWEKYKSSIKIWDVTSGKLLHRITGHIKDWQSADEWHRKHHFNLASDMIVSGSWNQSVNILEASTGKLIRQFAIKGDHQDLNFKKNLLLSYRNSTLSIYRISDGKELFSFIPIDSLDWVVVDPEGRFDASQNAMNMMHFALGNEIIEFQQLKDRFYEPGLVEKILGSSKEPLRKSRGLNNILLHPGIELTPPSKNNGNLGIRLVNRGGGIGSVKIWVNGKEVETDVRGKDANPDAEELEIIYVIQNHPYIKPGELNTIEVKAFNKEEYLVSQGKKVYYLADGIKKEPKLYALVAGSSNYNGDALDLNFAAKDAHDFANALALVGNKLFGEDNVDINLLSTQEKDFSSWPTKENIERTFKEISTSANPFDILVVYLSGHGTNYGGSEGDFYYLTSDAASGRLSDPVVREQVAISSEEFIEYFKWVPALKQVMIMDACHSGQLAEDLLEKREARSSAEIRALERMKDRTGMYVLAGSAADAVSYETSIYGQGLLTYSLLFGMKGASLRENKFVDIMQLFQFAADKVPELANNIGGIQKPEVRVPYGGQSFDIGLVTENEQNKIKLPSPRPLFLRSSFSDENTFDDHLRISELLDEAFGEQQANGGSDQIIFIDAVRFTGAYSLKGRYVKKGDNYIVQVRLFKGNNVLCTFDVEGPNAPEIVKMIMERAVIDID